MFLDDQLLEIGRKSKNLSIEEKNEVFGQMLQICFANIRKIGDENLTDAVCMSNLKRVHNTWNKVADILENEGINVIYVNEFKKYVEDTSQGKLKIV